MRIGISALALRSRSHQLDSGIARYCFALLDHLVGLGGEHEFEVFVSPGFVVPESWRAAKGFRFSRSAGPLSRHKTLWDHYGAKRAARRQGLDVWFSTAHALPAGCTIPRVLAVHDLFTFSHPQLYTLKHRLVVGLALDHAIRSAERIIAMSQHTKSELQDRFRVDPERVSVVPLAMGSTLEPRSPGEVSDAELEALGIPAGPFLLTLSTLEPRKNLPRLFEAVARIVMQPAWSALHLVVVGARGWKTSPIFRAIERLGLRDRAHFLGYVPDQRLPALFARCEAFVLPSLVEGFGLPVLEAMHLGAPVACSRAGSLPEVAGEAAGYFDPEDVVSMVHGILEILEHPELRAGRIAAGKMQAAKFDWRVTAARTLEVLESAA